METTTIRMIKIGTPHEPTCMHSWYTHCWMVCNCDETGVHCSIWPIAMYATSSSHAVRASIPVRAIKQQAVQCRSRHHASVSVHDPQQATEACECHGAWSWRHSRRGISCIQMEASQLGPGSSSSDTSESGAAPPSLARSAASAHHRLLLLRLVVSMHSVAQRSILSSGTATQVEWAVLPPRTASVQGIGACTCMHPEVPSPVQIILLSTSP